MSPDGMRVLMVTPFSPLQAGGVQRYVWEVCTRLLHKGIHVEVLCSDPTGEHRGTERHGELLVHSVPAYPPDRDWCFAPAMWGEIGAQPWDLVHVQCYHTLVAPLAMLRSLSLRVPYCVTFHGGGSTSEVRNRARPVQRRILSPLLARAAGLVAVARFEAELFSAPLGIPRERIQVVPVGTDLLGRVNSPVPSGSPVIGSIGRLERYKGHHRVIEALPELLKVRPDARLVIVGRGPYEDALRQSAVAHGVAESVDFTHVRPGDADAMAEVISKFSLVVLMSEFETCPLVAMDVAAVHRPLIVANDGAGLREFAEDGMARMVSLDSSPRELAAAIAETLGQPFEAHDEKLLSWDDCAEAMLSLYADVLGR